MEARNFSYTFRAAARGSPESEYSEPSEYATSSKDKFCPAEHMSDSLSFLRCMRKRLENLSRRIPPDKSAAAAAAAVAGRLESQKTTAKPVEGSGDLLVQDPALHASGEAQLRVAQEEIETVLRTSLIGLRQASRLIKGSGSSSSDVRPNHHQPSFSRPKPQDTTDTTANPAPPIGAAYKRKQPLDDELYESPPSSSRSPAKRSALASSIGLEKLPPSPPVELEAIAEGLRVLLNGLREDQGKMVCSASVQTSSNFASNKAAYASPVLLPQQADYANTESSSSASVEPRQATGLINQPSDWCYSDRRLAGPFSPKPRRSTSQSDVFRMLTTIERSLELLAAEVRQENCKIVDLIARSSLGAKSRVSLEKDRVRRHHHHPQQQQQQQQSLPTREQVFELKQAVEDLIYKVLFKRRKLKRLLRLQLKDRSTVLDPSCCCCCSSSTADYPSSSPDSSVDSSVKPPAQKPSCRRESYTHSSSSSSSSSKKEIGSSSGGGGGGAEMSSAVKHRHQKTKGVLGEDATKYEMLMALKVLRRDADRLINSLAVDKKRSSAVSLRAVHEDSADEDM